MKQFFAKHILLDEGWANDVLLKVDCNGVIQEIKPQSRIDHQFDGELISGSVIPGMVNNHSHAFQWAMAGLAEQSGQDSDSFWTWRNAMYNFVGKVTPDDLRIIASALYMQMLKAGYTSVGEFHYLHHDISGTHYSNQAEMSLQLFEAAKQSGIGMTLLPVFYRYAGFGEQPANQGQKRFIHDQEAYANLLSKISFLAKEYNQNFGIAPHSLRAVSGSDIKFAINTLDSLDRKAPIHIHIAEQVKEVSDCIAHYSQRPVDWLMKQFELNERWCLVHATHMTEQETFEVAQSKAVVSVCTTTEANLGDGFFNMMDYKKHQGRWSVGSDSHITVSATEELRWLEYQQRLMNKSRTLLVDGDFSSNGHWLWTQAAIGGAQSLNRQAGKLKVGHKADWLELDNNSIALIGKKDNQLIDALIFNKQAACNPIKAVWVNGQQYVEHGKHKAEAEIMKQFLPIMQKLLQD
ncbi:MAG: formimidoylglutamate deiminase [Kangiellaceae bacterium]|nr:formimidoylglutamate deiminase [Kangiellaceae bacterium]